MDYVLANLCTHPVGVSLDVSRSGRTAEEEHHQQLPRLIHMSADRIFIVLREDLVTQVTGYIVRAHDEDDAKALVSAGMYIEETATSTVEHVSSRDVTVEEITNDAEGQERK